MKERRKRLNCKSAIFNLQFAILSALSLSSCAPPSTTVFVDVPAIVASTAAESPKDIVIPAPPKAEAGVFATMPGKPALPIKDRPKASGEELRDLIEKAQQLAIKRIESSLRRFYDTELRRFELEQQSEMSDSERAAYDTAVLKLRTIFEAYADRRMPVYCQLTLLAGFPDPNPESSPPENPLSPALQKRFDQTVDLRTKLKAIDGEFDQDVTALMSGVQDLTAEQRAAMLLRVEDYKRDLDRKAEEEAKGQVRLTASELGLQLIEPITITLPATAAESVSVPAQPVMPAPPTVPAKGILESSKDRERLIRHELGIWAKLNRFVVTESRSGHNDQTQEFEKWRSQFAVGR